jgi:uncharacterized protein YcbX
MIESGSILFQKVGFVRAIYRYPVKSMRGESLKSIHIGMDGLEGDRRAAFVTTNTPSFLLTARQLPAIVRYAPSFKNTRDLSLKNIRVKTPEGQDVPLTSKALLLELVELCGYALELKEEKHGIFDEMAISLISQRTIQTIGRQAGIDLDPRRFRPNLLIEAYHSAPFQEEQWIGGYLKFGSRDDSARIRAEDRDERCMVVNLDPETGEQNPMVLRSIARMRQECAGIYCSTETPGTIRVGDYVYLIKG